ncbi:hypothetical protein [Streptomyces lydicus]|uniref:hypothetical protein n=1 Tax=Streptomyces lydicus TaxID=47763 RepID=UPI00341BDEDF
MAAGLVVGLGCGLGAPSRRAHERIRVVGRWLQRVKYLEGLDLSQAAGAVHKAALSEIEYTT